MHEDEEIRYILEGSGFFDVRGVFPLVILHLKTPKPLAETPTDEWIRVAMDPGDLLVLPAGIYHRFTLDEGNNLRALRLFKVSPNPVEIFVLLNGYFAQDEPKWIPYNRSQETDVNPYRKDYLQSIGVGA